MPQNARADSKSAGALKFINRLRGEGVKGIQRLRLNRHSVLLSSALSISLYLGILRSTVVFHLRRSHKLKNMAVAADLIGRLNVSSV